MFLIALALLLLLIMFSDVTQRRIPNWGVSVAFALCAVLWWQSDLGIKNVWIALATLLFGLVLFYLNLFGAGDIKLLSVLSVAIDPSLYPLALVLMGAVGGILSLCYWIKYRLIYTQSHDPGLPFGVAICLACYPMIVFSAYL